MAESNRVDIRPALAKACEDFCNAIGYPVERLEIAGPHYRHDFTNDHRKEPQYPHADRAGCYVFANDAGQILYVGEGVRGIGDRVWSPFGRRGKGDELESFPKAQQWVKDHKPGFWAIAVPPKHWWLALALEGFLIEKLDPVVNTLLKKSVDSHVLAKI